MSDDSYVFGEKQSPRAQLRSHALGLMLTGMGYGAIFFIALVVGFYVLVGIGQILPEDSKTAPDPTPEAHLVLPAEASVRA